MGRDHWTKTILLGTTRPIDHHRSPTPTPSKSVAYDLNSSDAYDAPPIQPTVPPRTITGSIAGITSCLNTICNTRFQASPYRLYVEQSNRYRLASTCLGKLGNSGYFGGMVVDVGSCKRCFESVMCGCYRCMVLCRVSVKSSESYTLILTST